MQHRGSTTIFPMPQSRLLHKLLRALWQRQWPCEEWDVIFHARCLGTISSLVMSDLFSFQAHRPASLLRAVCRNSRWLNLELATCEVLPRAGNATLVQRAFNLIRVLPNQS